MEVRNANLLEVRIGLQWLKEHPFSGFYLDESLADTTQKVGVSSEINTKMWAPLGANKLPSGQDTR